jgi:L-threonylcarbamoyladenylate synthase
MYLSIDIKKNNLAWRRQIAAALNSGQVIVYPTDTIYGLGCRADKKTAIKRIYEIKKREAKKPLLVLVSSLAMVKRYCHLSPRQEKELKKIWSDCRPTSIILQHRGLLPQELTGDSDGLAVRLPKNDFLRKMIKMLQVPLVSTSFNISGEAVFDRIDNLSFPKDSAPDLLIDGGLLQGRSSRLLDLRGPELKILRD